MFDHYELKRGAAGRELRLSLLSLLFVLLALGTSCTKQGTLTPAEWAQDVDFVVRELPRRHPNPYHSISREKFEASASEFKARLHRLNEAQTVAGFLHLMALLREVHTTVAWDGRVRNDPYLPIRLYWFSGDGLRVLNAADRRLLGARLVAVAGLPINEACERLRGLVAMENEVEPTTEIPFLLISLRYLYGTGITSNEDSVKMRFALLSGETLDAELKPSTNPLPRLPSERLPLYQQHPRDAYWVTTVGAGETVYFRYSRCEEDPVVPIESFRNELLHVLLAPPTKRLVIDLRDNRGGGNGVLAPTLDMLLESPFRKRNRIAVITNRGTNSAAVNDAMRLILNADATVVGEPSGGKPSHYGSVCSVKLPNSGATLWYSTKYIRAELSYNSRGAISPSANAQLTSLSIMPSLLASPTLQDYLNGVDPALDAILSRPPPEEDDEMREWKWMAP